MSEQNSPSKDSGTAVALRYDGDGAPRVTAKGRGELADAIIDVAREHRVPLNQDPAMAQLLAQVPLGDEIPEQLYQGVAQVLVFVYALTGKVPTPKRPDSS